MTKPWQDNDVDKYGPAAYCSVPLTHLAISELQQEVARLRAVLECIRDTAYPDREGEYIWMDDETQLGAFIDAALACCDLTTEPSPSQTASSPDRTP